MNTKSIIHAVTRLAINAVFLAATFAAAHASSISFLGSFTQDDDVRMFTFTWPAAGDLTIRTWSYAGGMNGDGELIPAGGFDPILSLFDVTGQLIAANDNGSPDVPADPVTGNQWDAFLFLPSFAPGTYTLALTQADNSAIGPTLSDGFLMAGMGNFTGDETGNPGGSFFDISGSQRTDQWALDVIGSEAIQMVPEPATVTMAGTALMIACLLAALRRHRQRW
jgi:hypothetical protein